MSFSEKDALGGMYLAHLFAHRLDSTPFKANIWLMFRIGLTIVKLEKGSISKTNKQIHEMYINRTCVAIEKRLLFGGHLAQRSDLSSKNTVDRL